MLPNAFPSGKLRFGLSYRIELHQLPSRSLRLNDELYGRVGG